MGFLIFLSFLVVIIIQIGVFSSEIELGKYDPNKVNAKVAEPVIALAEISDYPYIVSVNNRLSPSDIFRCTGTLIKLDWVITSAACLTNGQPVETIEVSAGSNRLDEEPYTILAEAIYLNSAVGQNGDISDIMLIQLQNAFLKSKYISPILLPNEQWAHDYIFNGKYTCEELVFMPSPKIMALLENLEMDLPFEDITYMVEKSTNVSEITDPRRKNSKNVETKFPNTNELKDVGVMTEEFRDDSIDEDYEILDSNASFVPQNNEKVSLNDEVIDKPSVFYRKLMFNNSKVVKIPSVKYSFTSNLSMDYATPNTSMYTILDKNENNDLVNTTKALSSEKTLKKNIFATENLPTEEFFTKDQHSAKLHENSKKISSNNKRIERSVNKTLSELNAELLKNQLKTLLSTNRNFDEKSIENMSIHNLLTMLNIFKEDIKKTTETPYTIKILKKSPVKSQNNTDVDVLLEILDRNLNSLEKTENQLEEYQDYIDNENRIKSIYLMDISSKIKRFVNKTRENPTRLWSIKLPILQSVACRLEKGQLYQAKHLFCLTGTKREFDFGCLGRRLYTHCRMTPKRCRFLENQARYYGGPLVCSNYLLGIFSPHLSGRKCQAYGSVPYVKTYNFIKWVNVVMRSTNTAKALCVCFYEVFIIFLLITLK